MDLAENGDGKMDWMLVLYNGFNIGIERKKNCPQWVKIYEGYDIFFFTGLVLNLGFIRLHLGEFVDSEEFAIELENEGAD
jgi:hypothetical protein